MNRIRLAGALSAGILVACSAQTSTTVRPQPGGHPVIYAALGASETFGIGADDRYRQAWPQIFFNDVLPESSTLYNFGTPGATTAEALQDELPAALAVHPDVATVWLNVNDLVQGVAPSTYGTQLRQLLRSLRQGKRTIVLVANVPDLSLLPAFQACLQGASSSGANCPFPTALIPTAQQLSDLIAQYNAVIAQAVSEQGGVLVDLHAKDSLIAQHPEWLSSDGFHPNGQGYVQIARTFEGAYKSAR